MANKPLDESAALTKIGLRIAEIRERRGMTQAELADEMNVDPRNAQRYEAGANLQLATLLKLAHVLGVTPGQFFVSPRRRKRAPGRPPRRPNERSR